MPRKAPVANARPRASPRARGSRPAKLKTFAGFSHLPTELRHIIWGMALEDLGNRAIELYAKGYNRPSGPGETTRAPGLMLKNATRKWNRKLHKIMASCKDARDAISIALGPGRLRIWVIEDPFSTPGFLANATLPFNKDTDMLFIASRRDFLDFWGNVPGCGRDRFASSGLLSQRVQQIALVLRTPLWNDPWSHWYYPCPMPHVSRKGITWASMSEAFKRCIAGLATGLPTLKTVVLVSKDDFDAMDTTHTVHDMVSEEDLCGDGEDLNYEGGDHYRPNTKVNLLYNAERGLYGFRFTNV